MNILIDLGAPALNTSSGAGASLPFGVAVATEG